MRGSNICIAEVKKVRWPGAIGFNSLIYNVLKYQNKGHQDTNDNKFCYDEMNEILKHGEPKILFGPKLGQTTC